MRFQVKPSLGGRPAELRVLYGAVPSGGLSVLRLPAGGPAEAAVVTGLRRHTTYRFIVLPVTGRGALLPSNMVLQQTAAIG